MKARDERATRKVAKSNSEQHQGLPVEADEPSQQPDAAAVAGAGTSGGDEQVSIPKPGAFDLNKFKSKHSAAVANVDTLLESLPHHNIAQAKDFVRLHPDENEYWSSELCFVNVPIKGQKRDTLHLINEDLGNEVSAERKDPALSSGARDQALRCFLSVSCPQ